MPDTLPTIAELGAQAERTFPLWGPNSGGGEQLVLAGQRLYRVAYGDASPSPDGSETVTGFVEVAQFLAQHGASADPRHRVIVDYLRAR